MNVVQRYYVVPGASVRRGVDGWDVKDAHTGEVVLTCITSTAACAEADRLNRGA